VADLTLTDPLGRAITLRAHTWYGHIVKGHPEVGSHRALIEAALRAPAEIRLSTSDAPTAGCTTGPDRRPGCSSRWWPTWWRAM
jgi:hypothetical protein